MRPVPLRATDRLGSAVPGADPHPEAPPLHGLGAMTAALVIVPDGSVCARSASAPGGRVPELPVGPREAPSGSPWMMRLSMGCGDETSHARLARPGSATWVPPA
jgi:hypothetical protein